MSVTTGSLVTPEKLTAALSEPCPHTLTNFDPMRQEVICICGAVKPFGGAWTRADTAVDHRQDLRDAL